MLPAKGILPAEAPELGCQTWLEFWNRHQLHLTREKRLNLRCFRRRTMSSIRWKFLRLVRNMNHRYWGDCRLRLRSYGPIRVALIGVVKEVMEIEIERVFDTRFGLLGLAFEILRWAVKEI